VNYAVRFRFVNIPRLGGAIFLAERTDDTRATLDCAEQSSSPVERRRIRKRRPIQSLNFWIQTHRRSECDRAFQLQLGGIEH
jgi:hypothetical protein